MNQEKNNLVTVNDLIVVAESVKAIGVVALSNVVNQMQKVDGYRSVKTVCDQYIRWIPKKVISNATVQPTVVFPNASITYTCKFTTAYTPYKTVISISVPEWFHEKMNDPTPSNNTSANSW